MRTFDQMLDLAAGATHGVTPDNLARIAWLCYEAQQAGGHCSVWHASSVVHGHRCNCAECHTAQQ